MRPVVTPTIIRVEDLNLVYPRTVSSIIDLIIKKYNNIVIDQNISITYKDRRVGYIDRGGVTSYVLIDHTRKIR